MPIFEKIRRILKSNINDLLDRVEDPERILNQLLEDMQHELKEAKIQVAAAIRDQNKFEAQSRENLESAEKWEKRAIVFIQNGDDVRAKEALRRKRSFADLAERFREQFEAQKESVSVLKDGLSTLEAKIEEARNKRALLIARQKRAEAERAIHQTVSGISDSSAVSAFNRIEDRVLDAEANAAALSEMRQLGLDQEFDELNRNDELEEELAKLKARLKD
ncbi:MAG: PspA/IM30 family protein [Candidatus Poribacteria bacterium]|nr:PspA/IM30 family protein [Candidatus Poribacteria bacterium]